MNRSPCGDTNIFNSSDGSESSDESCLLSDCDSDISFNQIVTANRYLVENEINSFCHFDEQSNLNILHLNCRSLKKNFDSLKTLLNSVNQKLTAIAISETWLTPSTEHIFQLQEYDFVSNSRSSKVGGGVGIYIDNDLTYKKRLDLSILNDIIECIFIEVIQPKTNFLIGCVYRPPGTDIMLFNDNISAILDKINSKRRPLLTFLTGDFNIDLLKSESHGPTRDFLNILNSYSFIPTIKSPTRITETSATLIDNIFINDIKHKIDSAAIYSDISDHLPIIIHFQMTFEKKHHKTEIYKRVYTDELIDNFCLALSDVNWDDIYIDAENNSNASELYDTFCGKFINIFNEYFPLKMFKTSKRLTPRQEWMTKALVKSCNKKSLLYKQFIKNKTASKREKYIKYRNKLNSLLKAAKQKYYENKFQAVSGNIHKTWQLLNHVMSRNQAPKIVTNFLKDGNIINSPSEIVEQFNNYFVNVGPRLARVIPPANKSFSSFLCNSPCNSLSLYLTNSSEIINVVKNLCDKTSYGFDSVPVNIVKKCISTIAEPLSCLINCSFRTGRFPDNLKVAKVCPIFKNGSENEFSNYRPISILPSFSKIYEKVAYNRLESFLLSNDSITKCQYGFRSKHSAYMALLDMYNKASESLDKGNYSVGIFIDLSKAFDTIDHDILGRKLEFYGVRGIALQWFKDYLSNRKQCVYFNDTLSSLKNVSCGIPQGSMLGPLLFILYINDIIHCSQLLHFILFADDTNLFLSNKNISELMLLVNTELVKLCEWFKANKLSLNAKKTSFMLFGRKGKSIGDCFVINIDGTKIERVDHTKFLGVYIDETLNWKQHTSHVSSKISMSIGVMNRVKCFLSTNVLKTLYFSLIHPYLIYCNIVWGNANNITLNKLTTLQKRAIRLITHSHFRCSTSHLFNKLKILKLVDIYKFQLGQFIFKSINNLLPKSSSYHIKKHDLTHDYPLRNECSISTVSFKTKIRENYIGVSGPQLWNLLPELVKSSVTFLIFKRNLKDFLLKHY